MACPKAQARNRKDAEDKRIATSGKEQREVTHHGRCGGSVGHEIRVTSPAKGSIQGTLPLGKSTNASPSASGTPTFFDTRTHICEVVSKPPRRFWRLERVKMDISRAFVRQVSPNNPMHLNIWQQRTEHRQATFQTSH